jgi:hypothetical protein
MQAKDFIVEDNGKMNEFYKIICALFRKFNPNSELLNKKKTTAIGSKSII